MTYYIPQETADNQYEQLCHGCDEMLTEDVCINIWVNEKIDDEVVICEDCHNSDEEELKQHGYKEIE